MSYSERWLPLAALSLVACGLFLHAHVYERFLSDDALISLRYARRWVEGHGLSWTGNEHVEGYTDFLWVALTAAGGFLRLDYIETATTLDHVGVLGALVIIGLSPRTGSWSLARIVTGGTMLAASIPVAVWANGGLEHGLSIGVLAGTVFLVERRIAVGSRARRWPVIVPAVALTLLRADGVLLVVLVLVAGFAADCIAKVAHPLVRSLPGILAVGAAELSITVFRRIYYHA